MSFQELCELAERELQVGTADERLLERALAEAQGVAAHARQIYWRLGATALQQKNESEIRELVAQLEAQEQRLRSRKQRYRWFWAVAAVTGLLGATLFPVLTFRAVGRSGPLFHIYFVSSVASLALAGLALIASKYHTHTE